MSVNIMRIRNTLLRRAVLVITLPIVVPLNVLYGAYIGMDRAVRDLILVIPDAWRGN